MAFCLGSQVLNCNIYYSDKKTTIDLKSMARIVILFFNFDFYQEKKEKCIYFQIFNVSILR